MIDAPQATVNVIVDEDGSVHFNIVSLQNADSVRIRAKSESGGSITTEQVGDSLKVSGPTVYQVVAVKDNSERIMAEHRVETNSESQRLTISEDADVSVEQIIDRYVRGDTWELELENELQIAMETA